jgi:hypothetical protein
LTGACPIKRSLPPKWLLGSNIAISNTPSPIGTSPQTMLALNLDGYILLFK